MRALWVVAVSLVLVLALASTASADAAYAPGQVVVRYKPGTGPSDRNQALADVDATSSDTLPIPDAHVADLKPGESVADAVAKLNANPDVRYAEPNYIYKPTRTPNDTLFGQQWAQLNTGQTFTPDSDGPPNSSITGIPGVDMGATTAWDQTTGSANVLVGVADTGVIANHEDLEGNVRRDLARDFRADNPSQVNPGADANGHGTHVAGTIGAIGNNSRGVAGVSWNPGIVPLRVLNPEGGPDAAFAAAFAYGGEAGLPIVNASLGGPGDAQIVRDAINLSPRTLFVIAAGNDENDNDGPTPTFPCSIPADNIICVAATNPRDGLASFSNFGRTTVDLGAPGTNILSTVPTFDTIRTAAFTAGDWPNLPAVWTLNPNVSLDAAWQANQDEVADLAGSISLANRSGCSAVLQGEVDMTDFEAALTLERSLDDGLTWETIDTIVTRRTNDSPSPLDDRVDMLADNAPDVQLRLHWATDPNLTGNLDGLA
jgi:subtilisin family serine protease